MDSVKNLQQSVLFLHYGPVYVNSIFVFLRCSKTSSSEAKQEISFWSSEGAFPSQFFPGLFDGKYGADLFGERTFCILVEDGVETVWGESRS